MNCGGNNLAIVAALLRYSVRMVDFAEVETEMQRQRCLYLTTACAARLLAERRGDCCEYTWMEQAGSLWLASVVSSVLPPMDDESDDILSAYLNTTMSSEAWTVDPITREQLSVADNVFIHAQLLPFGRESGWYMQLRPNSPLIEGLRQFFIDGRLPSRLLVVGHGGSGKTVLTKQIIVENCLACQAGHDCFPFRFALPQIAPFLTEHPIGWNAMRAYLERAYGKDSIQVHTIERAMRQPSGMRVLVLDALDEVGRSASFLPCV